MFKQTKAYTSIRNKLVAALAMLLVASIMMVSTSYAWFTLSTAPEVTGITTTIGANGNLEIALSPEDNNGEALSSNLQDSTKDWTVKNRTWGNLVDLSDISYGLDNLVMNPSDMELSSGKNALIAGGSPLAYPSYGYDGRPGALKYDTSYGTYSTNEGANGKWVIQDSIPYGVRGVGYSASLSPMQIGLSQGMTTLTTTIGEARTAISAALSKNGPELADMLIKHQNAGDNDTNDYRAYYDTIARLIEGADSAADSIEAGLRAALKVMVSSNLMWTNPDAATADAEDGMATYPWNETEYDTVIVNIETMEFTALMTEYADQLGDLVTGDSAFAKALAQYQSIRTVITQAETDLQTAFAGDDAVAWTAVSTVLNPLVKSSDITVYGHSISDITSAVDQIFANGKIELKMGPNSGLFADIAKMVGDYSAGMMTNPIPYGGQTLPSMAASMVTGSIGSEAGQVTPAYMEAMKALCNGLKAGSTNVTVSEMDTMYGYVIDLFVRTNAVGSNLLLQTEAANRIYANSDVSSTMGGGANMTFKFNEKLTPTQMEALSSAMRVVFFNPQDNDLTTTVYAEARLDWSKYSLKDVNGENMYVIPLRIWVPESVEVVEDTETGVSTTTTIAAHFYGDPVKHTTRVGEGEATEETKVAAGEDATKQILTDLDQNKATAISVLVYMDGNTLESADMAYDGNSMTGKLNLQFASDASLKPMDFGSLKTETTEESSSSTASSSSEDAGA